MNRLQRCPICGKEFLSSSYQFGCCGKDCEDEYRRKIGVEGYMNTEKLKSMLMKAYTMGWDAAYRHIKGELHDYSEILNEMADCDTDELIKKADI